ncbi:hypothetical protein [Rhizobium sp. RU36D]|uniref:O-linked N-acetylglucosamine transferase, SPINDLY family protein n=1 Tax=Rhizobium sp. RU36D TaxID=1907415 RepID=UPI001FCD7458|nr:hypothetical protein [Rhizobium sp. RU36D]
MQSTDSMARAQAAFDNGQYSEALEVLNGIIATNPDGSVLHLMARSLEGLGLIKEAIEAYLQASQMVIDPRTFLARAARLSLNDGLDGQAMSLALDLRQRYPKDPEAAFVLAKLGSASGNRELVKSVQNDLVDSDDPEHLLYAIGLLTQEWNNERNIPLFSKLRAIFPEDPFIRMALLGYAREFCDYDIMRREEVAVADDIARGDLSSLVGESPHYSLMWCRDESLNRLAANTGPITQAAPNSGPLRWAMPHQWQEKLRIGYVSSDLWDDHSTMRLFQSVLERHDRDRFETTLYCSTPDKYVAMDGGNRVKWGRIVRIGEMDDMAAAQAIRNDQIDILVDLKGHTENSRSGIMNLPVAPIHVQWLGFPGSCVNVDCDYVIGDRFVLPESSKPHYHEKFCRLPETYQPNDPVYRALPPGQPRHVYGLPADRFVFAAFHSQRKNSLECLSIWADVLRANPQSLLWIMCNGGASRKSTAEEFRRLGIKAGQLLFAAKTDYKPHIVRIQAADLGLDSFPYNGHTTTSDMLWAGVPVATFKGTNFASRVSESLLNAIGLPQLVAEDREDYVRLCTQMVQNREELRAIRRHIADHRFSAPLFDDERFCRHLESAFEMMAARAKAGLAPDHFDVPAMAPRVTPFRAEAA